MTEYKKGQLVTLRRKVVDVTSNPFKFVRRNVVCRIKELPDGNYINSPCDFCNAKYCHCSSECKLDGTSLFYERV